MVVVGVMLVSVMVRCKQLHVGEELLSGGAAVGGGWFVFFAVAVLGGCSGEHDVQCPVYGDM